MSATAGPAEDSNDSQERYYLTPAQAACLTREQGEGASPAYAAGFLTVVPGLARAAEDLLPKLFADGSGASYDDYGEAVGCGVCRMLGVWQRHALVPTLRELPRIADALSAGCAVADVGCGCGEAAMQVAAAFPACTVVGYDVSERALGCAGRVGGAACMGWSLRLPPNL